MNDNIYKIINILKKIDKKKDLISMLNDFIENNNHLALMDSIILLLDLFNIDTNLRQYIDYSNSEQFFILFLLEFCNNNKIILKNIQSQIMINYIKRINKLLVNDLLYQNLEKKRKKTLK